MLVIFTVISRLALESSLDYLVCPDDKTKLALNTDNSDLVSDGEFICTRCEKKYEIRNGVPYFFEKGNGFEWDAPETDDIIRSIQGTIDERELTWSKMLALGSIFLRGLKDRKRAIDNIFYVVERVVELASADADTQAFLMQAATAARYDIEVYRGTFTLPYRIRSYLGKNYPGSKLILDGFIESRGLVVEGACATGECLRDFVKNKPSDDRDTQLDFAIGLDISGAMVRNAQRKVPSAIKDYTLFVQGDICSLPLRTASVGLYIMNNVFDRVVDPQKACEEVRRIITTEKKGFFVLSNCDPLQYEYTTESGKKIVFVPKEKQISLERGLEMAGFERVKEVRGMWDIKTVAYDSERLPYTSLVGRR